MVERVLDGRYALEVLVGSGGMADVYRAKDQLLERTVAVKILHQQYENDKEFIERFQREAKAAARITHPNIVNVYDVGIAEGRHYIVMEYVPGRTLKERIKEEGPVPAAEALHIARQIAGALAQAHINNLVHCDIKPHNILVMPDGNVKVADFGIARAVTESTMTYNDNIMGSVHYFSPEQARGTIITPKSDVYSLGVVLYEMLTGRIPFDGNTAVSIARKHLEEEPQPLRSLVPNIPPVVEALVTRMMAKDPALRPDSRLLVQDITRAEQMMRGDTSAMPVFDPDATRVLSPVEAQEIGAIAEAEEEAAAAEEKSFFRTKKFKFGLVFILLLGFFTGFFLSFGKFWSSVEITVPDVTGKQLTLARQILEDQHLRVTVAETFDASVPVGVVVSQTPEAGSTVKEERTITIYVSKGGEEMEMPNLRGLKQSEAIDRLQQMGLRLGSAYETFSDEDAGTVISQDPRSGTRISKGQSVDITVSKGQKIKKVSVPNVKGVPSDRAHTMIEGSGLKVGSVSEEASTQAAGTVVSQSPAAGVEADSGSAVSLVISSGGKSSGTKEDTKGNSKKNDKDPAGRRIQTEKTE
ncbi:non-specific serine/threonine protein kinase [Centipeda periodontii DSM 2778]|uniref:non-specific serine/threonine protein kinase n=1 Tax=Centipeda periodontii DSM 2778 TaxID=888060 RepID=F5RP86_9FIRM|nr:Stk1 family PASTA domain-containing Ser/Thr kinase [Centipeda periodontii]EGK57902.1 non-specific serine/threonine protein kinase [Centipeda periodontii DSM 2778]